MNNNYIFSHNWKRHAQYKAFGFSKQTPIMIILSAYYM